MHDYILRTHITFILPLTLSMFTFMSFWIFEFWISESIPVTHEVSENHVKYKTLNFLGHDFLTNVIIMHDHAKECNPLGDCPNGKLVANPE